MQLGTRIRRLSRLLDDLAPREPEPAALSLAGWCVLGSRADDIDALAEPDQAAARLMLSPPDQSDEIEARIARVERRVKHGR
jgi:hypothetical protein